MVNHGFVREKIVKLCFLSYGKKGGCDFNSPKAFAGKEENTQKVPVFSFVSHLKDSPSHHRPFASLAKDGLAKKFQLKIWLGFFRLDLQMRIYILRHNSK